MLTSARDGPQTPEVATRAQSAGQKSSLLSSVPLQKQEGPGVLWQHQRGETGKNLSLGTKVGPQGEMAGLRY